VFPSVLDTNGWMAEKKHPTSKNHIPLIPRNSLPEKDEGRGPEEQSADPGSPGKQPLNSSSASGFHGSLNTDKTLTVRQE